MIKTSSLGDVVHALPAVTEAGRQTGAPRFDWVVEEAFAPIPQLHPGVDEVIPVAIRRWRKNWFRARGEIMAFYRRLARGEYDLAIDSQGLLKSAVISALAGAGTHGFDRAGAREWPAALFYAKTHSVGVDNHAILRQKQLFGAALGYRAGSGVDFGLERKSQAPAQRIMLLHGTTWPSKAWPESHWRALAKRASKSGWELLAPAGNDAELARAGRILEGLDGRVLNRLPLGELVAELYGCAGVVAVDTGLGHLASALGLPVVAVFGATDPGLTGVMGPSAEIIVSNHLPCIPCRKRHCLYRKPADSSNIHPPCHERTSPETVWQALQRQLGNQNAN